MVDPPGCAPKNPPPGEAIEGGEAGDEGLPLPVFGGLMRFSFCRLLKNKKSKSLSKVHLGRVTQLWITGCKTRLEPLLFPY